MLLLLLPGYGFLVVPVVFVYFMNKFNLPVVELTVFVYLSYKESNLVNLAFLVCFSF